MLGKMVKCDNKKDGKKNVYVKTWQMIYLEQPSFSLADGIIATYG